MTSSARALLFALALSACSGAIEVPAGTSPSPNPSGERGPEPPNGSPTAGTGATDPTPRDPRNPSEPAPPADTPPVCDPAAIDPGPAPMRLLTRAQYLQTVADLVGSVDGLPAALGTGAE